MSLDQKQADSPPIASVDELVDTFRKAEAPREKLRLGLEHEKFLYPVGDATPVPYEGKASVRALLERLAQGGGYQEFREAPGSPVIALQRGASTLSLEPGGQFELSGSPFSTAREAHAENLAHLAEVKATALPLGLRLVALGYRPFATVEQMPWMPKTRYQVMRDTLGRRGSHALEMMLMTSTGQVSLDWTSEADCNRKVVTSARVGPLLVALFANSPLRQGTPAGMMSFRSRVWDDVDKARCGYLPSMIDGSFSYQAYVDWALDAPLLFLRRRGSYLHPALTFRGLLAEGFEGAPALPSDWVDHLSTLFPEVRLKKVIEIRGADCVSAPLTGALAALMRGLLYDDTALSEAHALLPKLSFAEHLAFHKEAQIAGLGGVLQSRSLAAFARDLVGIARRGLNRLDPIDAPLLDPLEEVAASGRSPAQAVLDAYQRGLAPAALLDQFQL